jgi:hypothetical protein
MRDSSGAAAVPDAEPSRVAAVVSVVGVRVIIVSFRGGHSAVEIAVTING